MRLRSQHMLLRLHHNHTNLFHKYKPNGILLYQFSSFVNWNSISSSQSHKDQSNNHQHKSHIQPIRLVSTTSRAHNYDYSVMRSKNIYTLQQHWSIQQQLFGTFSSPNGNWKKTNQYFFSTAVTPPNNGNTPSSSSTLKTSESSSDEDNSDSIGETSKRREKARKLARKGASQAREGGSKMKELITKYGWYFGGTYFCIYLVTLSSFYGAIDSGFIDPSVITSFWGGELMGDGEEEVDAVKMIANMLEKWEWTRAYSESVEKNPKLTTLGVAWLGTKIIEPARIAVAVYVTPKVANAFGSTKRLEGLKGPSGGDTDHSEIGDKGK